MRRRARSGSSGSGDTDGGEPVADHLGAGYADVDHHVRAAVRRLVGRRADDATLHWCAAMLLRHVGPGSMELVGEVLAGVLLSTVDGTVAGGWDPYDLAQLVRRRDESWLPLLAAALHAHSHTFVRADARWRAAIEAIAPQRMLLVSRAEDVAVGLGLASLLASSPVLDEESFAAAASATGQPAEHRKWHQARALLAKAESTEFGPEAEALVAKAQELISRYSLERLLESYVGGASRRSPTTGVLPRRLWLDRPYVRAKGALVGEVARANHCRAALAEDAGFVLLVGHESDLGAVELLVTSLLAQADVAMLRRGRTEGRAGSQTRSRSFRQSFLMAFAGRIGQRLQAAQDIAVAEHSQALPVLRDHEARVSEAFDAMVPHTQGLAVKVTDYEGWVAGTAAADVAHLDVSGRLTSDAETGRRGTARSLSRGSTGGL
jgi:hypothetical protein